MDDQLQVESGRQRRWGQALLAGLVLLALATGAGRVEAAGGAGGAAPPPPPPPPSWDPERDRVIRIRPDGTRVAEPRTVRPGGGSQPSGPVEAPRQGPPRQGPPGAVAPFPQPSAPATLPTAPALPEPPPASGQEAWLPGAPAPTPPPPGQSPGSGLPPIPGVSDAAPAAPSRPTDVPPVGPPGPGEEAWLPGTEAAAPPPPPMAGEPSTPATREPVTPTPNEPSTPAAASVPSPAAVGEPDPWLVEGGPAAAAPPPSAPPAPSPTAAAPDPWDVADETTAPAPPTRREEAVPDNPWVPEPSAPAAGPDVFPPPGAGEAASRPIVPARPDAGTMRFESPATVRADEHVRRLLAAPGDRKVKGYPAGIVPRADPAVAGERGHRPVVLLFYDDASRASDLQAAEFLPVLVKFSDRIDIVPIDVTNSTAWSPEERKLVRTYYMASVPTTVVLAGDRRPLLLKFQRIDGATLEAKLEANLPR